ncbi:exodeoxyribonuclease V subunit beta [Agarivorans sp. TSD2052]|uniref:exodeoxyribonuclease V subunit beta n=1 Tax=Agarivorans sp. TSD2052 TaxID=2937286 RepID=UPI00200EC575|nr:exodeoxyribonuclease V subunit beta [Agarivorans sp. TSD2052]UPW19039.1 exodeoxyribonuclease V subunit beta [Agarivorans sp. TSD2052]
MSDVNVQAQTMSPLTSTNLDAFSFPLSGARLIEASAGTGKTYTIGAFVLRLLLGHERETGQGFTLQGQLTPLSIEQILVVTFTEAATQELRGRIREKIHEARIAFLRGESSDFFISKLLNEVSDHPLAAQRLLLAEQNMDQAAVFTIHGFCQRMLKQHAFESGLPFEMEFLTNEIHLRLQAVQDCWRQRFYPLPVPLISRIVQCWASPKQLHQEIGSLLNQSHFELQGVPDEQNLEAFFAQQIARIDTFKQLWKPAAIDIAELIATAPLNGNKFRKASVEKWLALINQFVDAPTDSDFLGKPLREALQKFTPDNLANGVKAKGQPPEHPAFVAIERLFDEEQSIKNLLLAQLLPQIRQRFSELKQQQQLLSFDDLLAGLAKALSTPQGGVLAKSIAELYPVAMIDEFQDTDPQQYQIFSQLYMGRPDSALMLIGDPKQAIYGFRGADIFTYMQARNNVTARYNLPTNWRSTGAMVNACNQLFEWHQRPFIYDDAIQFIAVDAAKKQLSGLQINGERQAAMQFLYQQNPDFVRGEDYINGQALECAQQIQQLLEAGQNGTATLGNQGKTVQAGDIAVLVRTRREGEKVASALAKQNIASVSLSNRDSVFESPEAYQFYLQLLACQEPHNDRKLRAALACKMLGLSLQELDDLNTDERCWQRYSQEFFDYQQLWQQRGVLAMFYRWMSQRAISERWISQSDNYGERLLTNLMHLAELLQNKSAELDGDAALMRWFAEQLLEPDGNADDQQLRLESDANLVQIVTIHKSKGLEYPIVMLPFILGFREASEALYHQDERFIYDLDGGEQAMEAACQERLAEDLRLLYVAVTRAVYCCYLGVADLKKGNAKKGDTDVHQSALGYLLQKNLPQPAGALVAILDNLSQHPDISWQAISEQVLAPYQPIGDEQASYAARQFTSQINRNWWLTSYSALSRHQGHQAGFDASSDMAWLDVAEGLASEELEPQSEQALTIFDFPRGAEAGTFLHLLFEEIDFQADIEEIRQALPTLLHTSSYNDVNLQGELIWLEPLAQMFQQVCATPLDDGGNTAAYSLSLLGAEQRLVEMEFFLPIADLQANQVNRLIRHFDPLSRRASALDFSNVQGMLKGFIDLVYQHNGRYYVLDYKSNYLGDKVADYQQQAMVEAMVEHRYDFQYQLYSLALHRWLGQRLPDYDYQQHFGGVYYLFLRGMSGEQLAEPAISRNGVYFSRPSVSFIHYLDQLFAGQALPTELPAIDNNEAAADE